jgi:hypothetical protein
LAASTEQFNWRQHGCLVSLKRAVLAGLYSSTKRRYLIATILRIYAHPEPVCSYHLESSLHIPCGHVRRCLVVSWESDEHSRCYLQKAEAEINEPTDNHPKA